MAISNSSVSGSKQHAIRGTEESLNAPNNENCLGLVQLVAKFDPAVTIQEHVQRISNDEIHDHYLGKQMQKEFIYN